MDWLLFIEGMNALCDCAPLVCEKCSTIADDTVVRGCAIVLKQHIHLSQRGGGRGSILWGLGLFVFSWGPFYLRHAIRLWLCHTDNTLKLLLKDFYWTAQISKGITAFYFCQQISKMPSSCLTEPRPTRWKSLTPSVVTWSGLWAKTPPTQRSCMSLESPKLKVGSVRNERFFLHMHDEIGANTLLNQVQIKHLFC